MIRRITPVLLLTFLTLTGCYTVDVPLDNQQSLDRVGLVLPDTSFSSPKTEQTVLSALAKDGFHWNNPRYSLGHHLIAGNRLVFVSPNGQISILRYTARFQDSGFRINRYRPTRSGDLMQKGTIVTKGLMGCIYNRPGTTFASYRKVSSSTVLADGLLAGAINTFLFPLLATWCEAVDRLPLSYHSLSVTTDDSLSRLLNNLEEKAGNTPSGPSHSNLHSR
ncbi:MAG: hypothetical protein ACYCTV_02015 [Leptospirales bacterium]